MAVNMLQLKKRLSNIVGTFKQPSQPKGIKADNTVIFNKAISKVSKTLKS